MPDPSLSGDSPAFQAFLESALRAAASHASVLLCGESGSGKSTAARWIHARSPRRARPCIAVSLAALSESLIEAELFGHEQGAFTDARRARSGRFRQADGGTLILEDVDLLPKAQQVKLLRVLQERVVEPLGAEAPIPIDVRVIATAGTGLPELVRRRAFRDDLYWRLAVVALEVPPLRARLADLPQLVAALVPSAAARVGATPRAVSAAALQRLGEHGWPGNVRELENALERALVLAPRRKSLDVAPAALEPGDFAFLDESRGVELDDLARAVLARGVTLAELERVVLARALAEQRGNVSAAARQVGLTRRALEYRLAAESAPGAAGPAASDARANASRADDHAPNAES